MAKFHTIFNPPPCGGTVNDEPSLCQRQFAASCDINALIRRFIGGDTSVIVSKNPPSEQDLRNLPKDRFEAELIMAKGRTVWESLPVAVRQTYGSSDAFLKAYFAELEKQLADKSKADKSKVGTDKVDTDKGDTTKVDTTTETSAPKA